MAQEEISTFVKKVCLVNEEIVLQEIGELAEEQELETADLEDDTDATVEEVLLLPSLKDHRQGQLGAVFQGSQDLLMNDEDPSLTVAEAC